MGSPRYRNQGPNSDRGSLTTYNKKEDEFTDFCAAIDKALMIEGRERPRTVQEWREMMEPPSSPVSSPKPEQKEVVDEVSPPEALEEEAADEVPSTKQLPVPRKSLFKLSTALVALIFFFVIGGSVSVYVAYKDGWTPLHLAAWQGHSKVVRVLIDSKADVDATHDDGWTPLHLAARQGHSEVVRVLIDSKADVDATHDDGWTPLHLASF